MSMNPEVKQKWVTALRSGKYKKASHALKFINRKFYGLRKECSFCVLGVLCDLYIKEHPNAKWQTGEYYSFRDKVHRQNIVITNGETQIGTGSLPQKVSDWSGVPYEGEGGLSQGSLIGLNDTDELPFSEIADRIEAEL